MTLPIRHGPVIRVFNKKEQINKHREGSALLSLGL